MHGIKYMTQELVNKINATTCWTDKKGNFLPFSKQQYLNEIDIFNPITMFRLFYDLDIPFIRKVYLSKLAMGLKKGKTKQAIIGQYIATMKLCSYNSLTYRKSVYYNDCSFENMIKEITISLN